MAVTKHIKRGATLLTLGLLIVSYQNCSVDLASSTPGASSSCAPSADALTEFQIVESTVLLPGGSLGSTGRQACGACHASGGIAVGSFSMAGTAGSNNTAVSIQNFCSVQRKGKAKMFHYMEPSHSPGAYQRTDAPALADFLDKWL